MLIMTAKVNKTKIILALGAIVITIVLLFSLLGGSGETAQPTAATGSLNAGSNEERVKFLTDLGWEVSASPAESMQVRIPRETSDVFARYNELQKSQGFDLTEHAGHTVMRYVYEITNFPGATEPVYATLLVHKDKIIGGDITDTAPGGKVHGFLKNTPPQS